MAANIPGTEGYAEQAEALRPRYDKIPFDRSHAPLIDLLPASPSALLDIGAGTGSDAALLAAKGHRVVAVEPTDAFRLHAISRHKELPIEWIDDGLPDLLRLRNRSGEFDAVLMTAVWMHLNELERQKAMPIVAGLIRPGGGLLMTLRHGPVPEGRRMFQVSAGETVALAADSQLITIRSIETGSIQEANKKAGVTWTHLAFQKAKKPRH